MTSPRTRCRCGAPLPDVSSAAWCPVCFTPIDGAPDGGPLVGSPPFGSLPVGVPRQPDHRLPAPPASLPTSSIRSVGSWRDRWQATDLTFGVTGRIVATFLWTMPFLFFSYAGVPFGLVGAIAFAPIWVRGVRDLWRRADRMTAARSHRRGSAS